jgi:hypothetical protein
MKNTNIFLFLLLVIVVVSCTPQPLDIDIPEAPSKPVMASQFIYDSNSNQSVFTITLTRTLSVTKDRAPVIDSNGINVDENLFIQGAKVTLQTTGGTYELNEAELGVYIAINVGFQPGEVCKIEAKDAEGNTIVESKTIAMPVKVFSSVGIVKREDKHILEYTLEDNPSTSNWYVVNYFTREQKDSVGRYNDPKFIARQLTEQKLDFELYTDADFVNGIVKASKKLPPTDLDTMAVAVSEITKGYFDFLTVQKRYGKLINQLRGEALSFPTNVSGGLGYFNINQPQLYILEIKR